MDWHTLETALSIGSSVATTAALLLRINRHFSLQSKAIATLTSNLETTNTMLSIHHENLSGKISNLDRRVTRLEANQDNRDLVNIPSWLK